VNTFIGFFAIVNLESLRMIVLAAPRRIAKE
jgi:hypothetical protein